MPKRWMLLIVLTVSICGITWAGLRYSHEAPSLADSTSNIGKSQNGPALSPRTMASPGSNGAPPSAPVVTSPTGKTTGPSAAPAPLTADSIGKVQPVRADNNAQTALIASAVKAHQDNHLSLLAAATPFDMDGFNANPEAYAKTYAEDVQPSRVYQTAAPAPNVPVLTSLTPVQLQTTQDQTIYLRARTVPFGVISWVTTDGGTFQNHLAAITVVADSHGVGSVSYVAGPGTVDLVKVQAGSPLSSGHLLYHIQVTASSHSIASSVP